MTATEVESNFPPPHIVGQPQITSGNSNHLYTAESPHRVVYAPAYG